MTTSADLLAAAAIYAEMTGCDVEIALADMTFRSQAVLQGNCRAPLTATAHHDPIPQVLMPAPIVVPVQAPLPLELTPFDNRRFAQALREARPGVEYSAGDLCLELNMEMPKLGSKRPTHLMKAAGWVYTGYRSLTTNRGQVYRKPLPHEVGK